MTTNSTHQVVHQTKTDTRHPAAEANFRIGHQRAIGQVDETQEPSLADLGATLADRVAYSVAEAVLITGLSRDLLYEQMRTGKLSYLKVGRRRIISRRNLEAFLQSAAS